MTNKQENTQTQEKQSGYKKSSSPFMREGYYTMYGTWSEMIYKLRDTFDANAAMELFKIIDEYSRFEYIPDFEDSDPMERKIISIMWPELKASIDHTVNRRARSFAKPELHFSISRARLLSLCPLSSRPESDE